MAHVVNAGKRIMTATMVVDIAVILTSLASALLSYPVVASRVAPKRKRRRN